MKNITHFMYVPFTGLGLHGGFRGDTWLLSRIKVFKEYVIPSLMAQSNQNFIIWISFRPEEEENPIVTELAESMTALRGIRFIMTFHGVCFWDDKYSDEEASRRLYGSLEGSLKELQEAVGESDSVLMTIQPSDDMYLSDMVDMTQRFFKQIHPHNAYTYVQGYIMDYGSREIAEYNPTTHPPFYTLKFSRDVFLDPHLHMLHTGPYHSHEYVGDYVTMATNFDRGFIVGTHGENISTTYNHPYRGAVLSSSERDDVLIKAGVWKSEPIVMKKNSRLYARRLLNGLPFQNIIRNFYYTLPKWLQKL